MTDFSAKAPKDAVAIAEVAIATLVILAGCDDVPKWTEDVKLHDGKTVQVERRATRAWSGFPVEHRGPLKTYELCYAPAKAYWNLRAEYRPASFELKDGVPYVKVSVLDCGACKAAGFPDDSMAYFALKEGQWVRITSSEFPDGRWRNLIIEGIWDGRDSSKDIKGHVTWEGKWKIDQFQEGTQAGTRVQVQDAGVCWRCSRYSVESDTTLAPTATPTDSFCK